ncbi:hypothetical protein ABPG75_009794 [Micractinium tetrahymenae]
MHGVGCQHATCSEVVAQRPQRQRAPPRPRTWEAPAGCIAFPCSPSSCCQTRGSCPLASMLALRSAAVASWARTHSSSRASRLLAHCTAPPVATDRQHQAQQPPISGFRRSSSSGATSSGAAMSPGEQAGPAHRTPSAQHLRTLTHILNARDLAEAYAKIKPGRIFRSGSPAHASQEDVLVVRRDLRVQHMIDFRSSEEHKEDTAWSLMLSNGIIKTYNAAGRVTQVSVDHNAALHGVELQDISLHRISLMERNRVMRGMISKLPVSTLLRAGFYKLTGNDDSMRDTLVPEINRGGLLLIYQILVDTAQADIAKTLQIMTAALEAGQPCLFFCKLGKDRTGLMAALVLSVCGASEEEIVADYIRSAGVHQVALGGLEKQGELKGMDEAVFSAAPPEAMRGLLQYCKERWGGMREYLAHIGFDRQQQERLAAALTDGDW